MVDAMIRRNLQIFADRARLSSVPTGKWAYRLAIYREREDYEFLSDWQPLGDGMTFSTAETFFGRMTFTPAAPAAGQTAFLELCTAQGCEAFVSLNGVRWAGVNNDQGRNRVYLPPEMLGAPLTVEIELFASRHAGGESRRAPISSCRWVTVDDALMDFSRNMDLLWETLPFVKGEYTREKLRALLEETIRESDAALEGEAYRACAARLNGALQDALAALGGEAEPCTIACVASTHIDVAWLWQYKDTIRKAGRTALNQFRLMDRYPEFAFALSQPSVYQFIKDVYPDVFEEIRRRVADGSWQLVGPMWVESDLNLSGLETLIREFLYGHAFFKKEFGRTSEMCWIPDSFGFPATLPQIFVQCGMKYFYTTKVRWQAAGDFPYNVFVWEGLDGSRLLATIPKTSGMYNGQIRPDQLRYAADNIQQKAVWDKTLFSYGFGDGGGGPTEQMLENYRRLRAYPGMPHLELVRAEDYFRALEAKRDDLPVWRGELCVETHQGTYTTVAENKRANRCAESAYRRLDLLAAMARLPGSGADYEEIRQQWKTLLLLQFHDVLPGSSIDAVYADTRRMYRALFDFAAERQAQLLASALAPTPEADALTVFNPNSFAADAYVRADSRFAGGTMTDGTDVVPVLSDGAGGFVFRVRALPGFSARVYRPAAAAAPPAARIRLTRTDAGIAVETPHFTFTLAPDGTLRDFLDRRQNFLYSTPAGLNRFVLYKDGPEREDAWNIDKEYRRRPLAAEWEDEVTIAEENGERAVLRVRKAHGETVLTQDIVVYADIARVDFFSHVEWQEKYRLLQLSFPTTIVSPAASYEVAGGIVRRTTHPNTPAERWRHEFAAHRFLDLSDEKRGAALLNDSKYGHNVIDGEMTVTLLRSTEYPSRFIDRGPHDFAYAFLPHAGGVAAGGVAEAAYLFNSPLVTLAGGGTAVPPLTLSDGGMLVDCVKPAEDGDGIVVRLYEPYGTSGSLTVALPRPARVAELNAIEEECAALGVRDRWEIAYRPFEIRTYRLTPGAAPAAEKLS